MSSPVDRRSRKLSNTNGNATYSKLNMAKQRRKTLYRMRDALDVDEMETGNSKRDSIFESSYISRRSPPPPLELTLPNDFADEFPNPPPISVPTPTSGTTPTKGWDNLLNQVDESILESARNSPAPPQGFQSPTISFSVNGTKNAFKIKEILPSRLIDPFLEINNDLCRTTIAAIADLIKNTGISEDEVGKDTFARLKEVMSNMESEKQRRVRLMSVYRSDIESDTVSSSLEDLFKSARTIETAVSEVLTTMRPLYKLTKKQSENKIDQLKKDYQKKMDEMKSDYEKEEEKHKQPTVLSNSRKRNEKEEIEMSPQTYKIQLLEYQAKSEKEFRTMEMDNKELRLQNKRLQKEQSSIERMKFDHKEKLDEQNRMIEALKREVDRLLTKTSSNVDLSQVTMLNTMIETKEIILNGVRDRLKTQEVQMDEQLREMELLQEKVKKLLADGNSSNNNHEVEKLKTELREKTVENEMLIWEKGESAKMKSKFEDLENQIRFISETINDYLHSCNNSSKVKPNLDDILTFVEEAIDIQKIIAKTVDSVHSDETLADQSIDSKVAILKDIIDHLRKKVLKNESQIAIWINQLQDISGDKNYTSDIDIQISILKRHLIDMEIELSKLREENGKSFPKLSQELSNISSPRTFEDEKWMETLSSVVDEPVEEKSVGSYLSVLKKEKKQQKQLECNRLEKLKELLPKSNTVSNIDDCISQLEVVINNNKENNSSLQEDLNNILYILDFDINDLEISDCLFHIRERVEEMKANETKMNAFIYKKFELDSMEDISIIEGISMLEKANLEGKIDSFSNLDGADGHKSQSHIENLKLEIKEFKEKESRWFEQLKVLSEDDYIDNVDDCITTITGRLLDCEVKIMDYERKERSWITELHRMGFSPKEADPNTLQPAEQQEIISSGLVDEILIKVYATAEFNKEKEAMIKKYESEFAEPNKYWQTEMEQTFLEKEQYKMKYEELNVSYQQLKEEVDLLYAELDDVETKMEEEDKESKPEHLRNKVQHIVRDRDSLLEKMHNYEELQGTVKGLRDAMDKVKSKKEQDDGNIVSKEQEIHAAFEQWKKDEKFMKESVNAIDLELHDKNVHLENEMKEIYQKLTVLQDHNNDLSQKLQKYQSELTLVQESTNKSVEEFKGEMEVKLFEKESEIEDLTIKIEELEQKTQLVKDLEKERDQMAKELEDIENSWKKDYNSLMTERDQLNEKLSKTISDKEHFGQKILQLENSASLAPHSSNLEDLEKKNNELTKLNDRLEKENETLKSMSENTKTDEKVRSLINSWKPVDPSKELDGRLSSELKEILHTMLINFHSTTQRHIKEKNEAIKEVERMLKEKDFLYYNSKSSGTQTY